LCYRLGAASNALCPYTDREFGITDNVSYSRGLESLVDSLANEEGGASVPIRIKTFLDWADNTAPMIASPLETFMESLLFASINRATFQLPDLQGQPSVFFDENLSCSRLFEISSLAPCFCGKFQRVFSPSDGFCFNRLQHSLLGYSGPTLMIIKAVSGGVFGAFTTSQWRESPSFYGNSDMFLFRLEPQLKVFRPIEEAKQTKLSKNYMYFNSRATAKGAVNGLGFGGTMEKPRLFISETFEGCEAGTFDYTFEPGPLLASEWDRYFDIEDIEVWGIGTEEILSDALKQRNQQQGITASNARKAQMVDKSALLCDFSAGFMENKMFSHQAHVSQRTDINISSNAGAYSSDVEVSRCEA